MKRWCDDCREFHPVVTFVIGGQEWPMVSCPMVPSGTVYWMDDRYRRLLTVVENING